MKKFLLNLLMRFYSIEYSKPLSEKEIDDLLTSIATSEYCEKFTTYLEQCANSSRNRYLYTDDQSLKGAVFALVSLKEQILKRKPILQHNLTDEQNRVIDRGRGY